MAGDDGYIDIGDGLSAGTQTTTFKVYNDDGSVQSTKTESYESTIYTGNGDAVADAVSPETNPNRPPTKRPGLFDDLLGGLRDLEKGLAKGVLVGGLALAGVLLLVYAPELKYIAKRVTG